MSFQSNFLHYKSPSFILPTQFHNHLYFILLPSFFFSSEKCWSQIPPAFCLKVKRVIYGNDWKLKYIANKIICVSVAWAPSCHLKFVRQRWCRLDAVVFVVSFMSCHLQYFCGCVCVSVCSLWQALPWWWAVMGWSFMPPPPLWTIWDFIRWVECFSYILEVQHCE